MDLIVLYVGWLMLISCLLGVVVVALHELVLWWRRR